MSVTIRGRKFHYRFQFRGNSYSGVCNFCAIPPGATDGEIVALRKKALAFEAEQKMRLEKEAGEQKEIERDIRKNKTVQALVENYKYELTGGKPITLDEAFELAMAKPTRREARSGYAKSRGQYWKDFRAFMSSEYPEATCLNHVRRAHCEAYVSYLVKNGRFVREVSYAQKRRRKSISVAYVRKYSIGPKTIRETVSVCRRVFSLLEEDAGLVHNPWNGVILPIQDPVEREIFTPAELKLIWDGIQDNTFCYPLFMVAANSGMTEGDICTLRWDEIEWGSGCIRRKRRKTGTDIRLPLLPQLADYLRGIPRTGEYVFPEHAEMYLRQSSDVSERVKDFLNGLGLVTTVRLPGRRAVSVKDLHSMRHVFCYRAKRAGIPESVIAKFVGHKVIAMTQHYADHDTDEELRSEIKKLPPLFIGETGGVGESGITERRKLAELAYSLPLEMVKNLLSRVSGPFLQPPCALLPAP